MRKPSMSSRVFQGLQAKAVFATALLATPLCLAESIPAEAQDTYPARLVRIIVPFPAGGTADVLPRIVAAQLSKRWRQPVIIENRAGAGGNIGAEAVAGSAPDGYVLLASPPGPIAINDNLYKKLAFQPAELEPIIVLGTVPNVLVVKPTFPAKTVQELIAYIKANPGKVAFASQGNGSTSHLSAMLFQKLTDTRMVHVPYRGTAPALQDIMGNHVDLFFDNLGSSLAPHNAGSLRILAVGSTERVPALPDAPTLEEAGVAGFKSITWFAVMAPPRTPAVLTGMDLRTAFEDARDDAEVRGIILTGAGDKAFIAGADIGELAHVTAVEAEQSSRLGQRVLISSRPLVSP